MIARDFSNKDTLIIIEARTRSSRLPNKVLLEILKKPVLQLMIERLELIQPTIPICVATTEHSSDDAIINLCEKLGVNWFRGDENNVLSRVADAARFYRSETIISLTADCPLIDPSIVSQMHRTFNENKIDFLTNCHVRSFPDGMDVQIFTNASIQEANARVSNSLEQEHTTLFIRNNPDLFKTMHLLANSKEHRPKLGLTLDEFSDFLLIDDIYRHFHPKIDFGLSDILHYLSLNPEVVALNAQVVRKGDS
jgi:spore coat polysaccharide biosynthesis protein SpsF